MMQYEQLIKEDKAISQAASIGKGVAIAMTVAIVVSTVISINYAIIMFKIYQMMDFMLLYSVNYPTNFEKFITIFKSVNPLNMLPDIFQNYYDQTCGELGSKFNDQLDGC